jgi:hypothetical protein
MFYTEECFDAYSIDMATWKRTQISTPDAIHAHFYVSPGREFYTYRYWSLEDFRNGPIHRYLVISDAKGNALKTIPWGDNWFDLIGWLDDRRLLFRLGPMIEDVDLPLKLKPRRLLVLDPFSGERWLLRPDLLPEAIDKDFSTFEATSWIDWHGGLYDPTLSRVIYPRIIDEENGLYTYSLFDLSNQQTVSDLEIIINGFAGIDYYPKPDWSPDASQFVVVGGMADKDSGEITDRELYRVTRDGQVEQMTHLSDSA